MPLPTAAVPYLGEKGSLSDWPLGGLSNSPLNWAAAAAASKFSLNTRPNMFLTFALVLRTEVVCL